MAYVAQERTLLGLLLSLGRSKKALPSATVTVDTTSTKIIDANKKRRSLVLTNTGANPIFIGINEAAVANQGIYLLNGGGVWVMDAWTYTNKKIYGIGIGGASNISIQEFE